MATATVKDVSGNGSTYLITWNLTTADPNGSSVDCSIFADRTVLMQSVAWGTSTCVMEGSNDNSVFVGLADVQGTAISKTANAIENIVELTRYIAPRLSVPGTAAAVTVSVMARCATPMRT